ncbi:MAG: purine-nucleoside phosphorylase, partial [Bacteroidia bacterium]|nr:purine-nucleoside phosphorylase [Bacteroidia bacterium]
MLKRLQETVDHIRTKVGEIPQYGLVLGSGLGGLVDKIDVSKSIPYHEISNFPI